MGVEQLQNLCPGRAEDEVCQSGTMGCDYVTGLRHNFSHLGNSMVLKPYDLETFFGQQAHYGFFISYSSL